MLIILPPSETKAIGGDGSPLDLHALSFPDLTPRRTDIATDLQQLCADDPQRAQEELGLSAKLADEVTANAQLFDSPTMPAIRRYTGVLYDALDAPSLPHTSLGHLAVGSALFGLVMASDPIPHYRLSGGSKFSATQSSVKPGSKAPTMKSRWGSAITDVLTDVAKQQLVVDLRSGTYQQLGRLKSAVTVRVESVQPDGARKVVSHFNKHYKGLFARELALAAGDFSRSTPPAIPDLMAIAERAGMLAERSEKNAHEIVLVVER